MVSPLSETWILSSVKQIIQNGQPTCGFLTNDFNFTLWSIKYIPQSKANLVTFCFILVTFIQIYKINIHSFNCINQMI